MLPAVLAATETVKPPPPPEGLSIAPEAPNSPRVCGPGAVLSCRTARRPQVVSITIKFSY